MLMYCFIQPARISRRHPIRLDDSTHMHLHRVVHTPVQNLCLHVSFANVASSSSSSCFVSARTRGFASMSPIIGSSSKQIGQLFGATRCAARRRYPRTMLWKSDMARVRTSRDQWTLNTHATGLANTPTTLDLRRRMRSKQAHAHPCTTKNGGKTITANWVLLVRNPLFFRLDPVAVRIMCGASRMKGFRPERKTSTIHVYLFLVKTS